MFPNVSKKFSNFPNLLLGESFTIPKSLVSNLSSFKEIRATSVWGSKFLVFQILTSEIKANRSVYGVGSAITDSFERIKTFNSMLSFKILSILSTGRVDQTHCVTMAALTCLLKRDLKNFLKSPTKEFTKFTKTKLIGLRLRLHKRLTGIFEKLNLQEACKLEDLWVCNSRNWKHLSSSVEFSVEQKRSKDVWRLKLASTFKMLHWKICWTVDLGKLLDEEV